MVTLDVAAYPETQIKTVGIDDTAWLLETNIETLLSWVDMGLLEAVDTDSNGNMEFRREDVADLLEKFGA
jgi:predicted site-specific integrase-resolvase